MRELLLAEEVAFTAQYVEMYEQANASKEDELKQKAYELQRKTEAQRKEFIDKKMLELKL